MEFGTIDLYKMVENLRRYIWTGKFSNNHIWATKATYLSKLKDASIDGDDVMPGLALYSACKPVDGILAEVLGEGPGLGAEAGDGLYN